EQDQPMHRLLLLRHAKSGPATPGQRDFDRPLAPRGIAAVPPVARYLAANAFAPHAVVCSPARRTRATLDPLLPLIPAPASVWFEPALQDGAAASRIAAAKTAGDDHRASMVIGHYPGMQEAAMVLAGTAAGPLRRKMALKCPTAAVAVIDFACGRWADVVPGS